MRANGRPRTAREKYGEELKLRRMAAGLTQEALADQVVCSPTLISHFEAGRRLPSPDDAQRIDRALGTDGFFARWLEDLDPAFPRYFTEVAELEREATEIRQYGAALIPGLLQTKAYSRAVFQAYRPNHCAEELDELVVSRAKRALLLDKPSAPVAWTLLDEAALRRRVGGSQVMARATQPHDRSRRRSSEASRRSTNMHNTEATIADGATVTEWRKSSYSGGANAECLEVADGHAAIPVRDSKTPAGPALTFSPQGWTRFVTAVKHGELSA
ncbi:Scr1 family TA system antitoxin-like transcriptional regulator [Streptomyces microflavus]|uniref:helix-turn-helix domain-containing protein n=1 Tax=Streptomyces microflavus TaxID=1919 RepID=UPI0037FC3CF9